MIGYNLFGCIQCGQSKKVKSVCWKPPTLFPLKSDIKDRWDKVERRWERYLGTLIIKYCVRLFTETLRKYPMVTTVRRVTTRPYAVPEVNGGGGGCVTLEPGTVTVVPVQAIHNDKRYFDEPETFQPHRFPEQLSSAYMPHGSGPRSYISECIVDKVALHTSISTPPLTPPHHQIQPP